MADTIGLQKASLCCLAAMHPNKAADEQVPIFLLPLTHNLCGYVLDMWFLSSVAHALPEQSCMVVVAELWPTSSTMFCARGVVPSLSACFSVLQHVRHGMSAVLWLPALLA